MRHDNVPPDPEAPPSGSPRSQRGEYPSPPASDMNGEMDSLSAIGDREVPIPVPGHQTPPAVQAWLDGEATSAMAIASQGGNDAVDLWRRINSEAELLKTRTTPLYVHKRIMESLPGELHRVHRPWYQRPVALNPMTLLAAAAALVGIGALVARVVAH
jgi:hypothetical protein